ncbi:MAG: TIGR02206 family membrane protein [Clostridia bacterium]|nr:TIGR02206 family membrane protein [Clostridia bacterium]
MLQFFFAYRTEIPDNLKGQLFSPQHLMTLTIILAVWVTLILLLRKRSFEARRKFLHSLCFSLPVLELSRIIWFVAIGHFSFGDSLPLHLCGLMCILMPLMAVTEHPILKEYAFAVGFAPAVIALLTPDVWDYPAISFQYIQSMTVHGVISFIPVFMVFAMGYKPDIRKLPRVIGLVLVFALIMVPVDLLTNGNYFFLFKAPPGTPIEVFDKLVGWPWYILPTFLLGCVLWGICYLPFEAARLLGRPKIRLSSADKG